MITTGVFAATVRDGVEIIVPKMARLIIDLGVITSTKSLSANVTQRQPADTPYYTC
jgi:hypothetical protein